MSIDPMERGVERFFAYARERYRIFLLREAGAPPPWTDYPVLRDFRFCNVFREDDRTTRWFRDNVREPLDGNTKVAVSTAAFRWFNRIPTGERLLPMLLEWGWDRDFAQRALFALEPLVTGAYSIKTPPGRGKLRGICDCMDESVEALLTMSAEWEARNGNVPLEEAHQRIMELPYLGSFMAYEVVTDLRHTHLLRNCPDSLTWAAPGPGCARGLGWITDNNAHTYLYTRKSDRAKMLELMRALLLESTFRHRWPDTWPRWELREVEHTLCEYDKFRRGLAGQPLRRRFQCPATRSS